MNGKLLTAALLLSQLPAACATGRPPAGPAAVVQIDPDQDADPLPPLEATGEERARLAQEQADELFRRPGSFRSGPVAPKHDFGKCLRSRLCELEGLCTPTDDGRCIAASNDDCRPSDACLGGRCTASEGRCIAGSDADCQGSQACQAWGRCAHDGQGLCIARSAADCQASYRCQREGECLLRDGACVKP